MELTLALEVANSAVYAKFERYLTDVETAILRGTCQQQTYEQIAEASGYSVSYLTRDVGPKLWKLLSQALGERVSKTNFQAALERYWQKQQQEQVEETQAVSTELLSETQSEVGQKTQTLESHKIDRSDQTLSASAFVVPLPSRQDWGEAVDVHLFYGRTTELNTLQHWILTDHCHLIAVLGMGGMGKTSLAVKLGQQIQAELDYVIWRSLRNAPPLTTLLQDWVSFLSDQQDVEPQLDHLLHWLRSSRCLLILDNIETILQSGNPAGQYRSGYEDYGELFKAVGERPHQSCLILTSREKPAEIAALEGIEFSVRSMPLKGCLETAQTLIQVKGLSGSDHQKQQLCDRYSSNPLALKIVATSIQDLFDGDIAQFLEQDTVIFNNIRRLLDQQFERLSDLEKTVMFWLTINREWTTIAELVADIFPTPSRTELLEALESLSWRSLIEKQSGRYTQQPVVMEYITDRLLAQITTEINPLRSGKSLETLKNLRDYPLIKAQARDYIRATQTRLILEPISQDLLRLFNTKEQVKIALFKQIATLQKQSPLEPNYLAGNLLNLLIHLKANLNSADLSHLSIWQTDFRGVNLQGVNFSQSNLSKSIFTEIFGTVYTLAFSSDNQLLATGHSDGEIRLWEIETGQIIWSVKGHSSSVLTLAFSSVSSNNLIAKENARKTPEMLVSGSFDKTIKLWNISTGKLSQTLSGHQDAVWSVAFSPNGEQLASCSSDRTLKIWNSDTGKEQQTLRGHTAAVTTLCYSPDGKLIASGSEDLSLRLWETQSGQCLQTLNGHTTQISSVTFSTDGQTLASCEEQLIKLWNVKTGECTQTLQDSLTLVWSVAFSPDGQTLAGSDGQILRLWDVHTGKCRQILSGYTGQIWALAFSPNGQMLAASDNDQVEIWNIETAERLRSWQGEVKTAGSYWSLAFDGEGEMLASGSEDGTVRLWDVAEADCLQILQHQTKPVRALAFTHSIAARNHKILASGGEDQVIWLWHISEEVEPQTLRGHTDTIWSVAFDPDGRLLASGSADQTIKIWDVNSGECLNTLSGHQDRLLSVIFSPDGQILASGSADQTLKIWDVNSGGCLNTLTGHQGWVWSVALSPDGQILASGSEDRTIKLWDVNTGECIATLAGHRKLVWSLAFSRDGQTLISGSADQTAKYWDIQTFKCRETFQGNTDLIWAFAYQKNQQILASGSRGENILLWNFPTAEPPRILQTPQPYDRMCLTGVTGLTAATLANLKSLGAQ